MKPKTPDQIDEMPRNKLLAYIEELHGALDNSQRELAEAVRYELDVKFAFDALLRKYNSALIEFKHMLTETYDVSPVSAAQIVREIDQHAASEAATYPRGGCSG